jgi:hypothetical protein
MSSAAAQRVKFDTSPLPSEWHREVAESFGNQAQRVVQETQARGAQEHNNIQEREIRVREAVTYSRARNIEHEAVVDERQLMVDALRRSIGESTFREVRENLGAGRR